MQNKSSLRKYNIIHIFKLFPLFIYFYLAFSIIYKKYNISKHTLMYKYIFIGNLNDRNIFIGNPDNRVIIHIFKYLH